jgi:transposase-like protein
MTFIAVRCPHCHSEQIVKRGKTHRGTQRYLYQNTAWGSRHCYSQANVMDSSRV